MGFIRSVCGFLVQSAFLFSLFTLAILLIPNLPPDASFQEAFKLVPPMPLEGKLALNERLNKLEIWHKGDLLGPEAFSDYNGELYTSIFSGEIVKLTGEQHITPIVRTGRPCRGFFEERICGRPLGLKFDKNGLLYVADAYYGIMKVNVQTGRKEVIIPPNQKIEGKQPKLFNSIALASNGDIFWTDSSTNFHLDDGTFDGFADGSGRLIHYDAKSKKNKVLMNNIAFANGVILSEDESEVIVSETFKARLLRYHLKGPKKGTHDVFIEGLPGLPDNLNEDGKGGYLVPLVLPVDNEHPLIYGVLGPFPLIRKFLARIIALPQMIFEMIDRAYPNDYSLRAIHFIGHFTSMTAVSANHRATIIRVSKTGEILDSVHTTNNKGLLFSEAHIFKDTLYLGTPFGDQISRIKLSEIGWEDLIQVRTKRSVEQPKETTQKTDEPSQKQTTPSLQQQTTPPPPKQTTPPPKKQTTAPPPKQTTPPPPKQTTPPPQKQTTPPPQKQATALPQKPATPPPQKPATPPPQKSATPQPQKPATPASQKSTTSQPQKSATTQPQNPATPLSQKPATPPPQKPATPPQKPATPPPQKPATLPPQKPATPPQEPATPSTAAPPPQKPATPPPQKPVTPLPQKPATPPPQKPATPPQKPTTPLPQQPATPPPQKPTTPTPQQPATPSPQKPATPPPQKQTDPPQQKQTSPPAQNQKPLPNPQQTNPPPKQQTPPVKETVATKLPDIKQVPPSTQQQTPPAKQQTPSPQKPQAQSSQQKQQEPVAAKTVKDQAKPVPVKETVKTK